MAPEACKQRARELVQKWREQDLRDIQNLATEGCAEAVISRTQWTLKQELVKLDRQSQLAELSCGCSTEILSQATNPPARPGIVKVVTEHPTPSENRTERAASIPMRYSSQVLAKKASLVISHNAAELLSAISGKLVNGLSAPQFDSDLSGQWNNQYRKALQSLVQTTVKLQTLSVELDTAQSPKMAGVQTTTALPQVVQTLIEQTRLLSEAYDGIVRERELPWGQCYEAFGIRHQLILNSVAPLMNKRSTTAAGG